MQYDPIKKVVSHIFSGSVFMRKILYFLLDILLLRAWHVRKALRKTAIKFPEKAMILDAGTGFGQYTWRMSGMNNKWRIKAIDIDRQHILNNELFIRKAGLSDRISFEILDLARLDETDAYDFILCVDVMEHIKEDETVFSNFCRALRTDGSLLISTPSDKGGSDVHDHDDQSFIDEHVRDGYGIDEISEKLEKAGFREIRASYTYGKPGSVSWKLSMKYPIGMLNISRLFLLILPLYFLVTFPVAALLNLFDVLLTHKSGTGLLVTATK